jgi:hypothetical protein
MMFRILTLAALAALSATPAMAQDETHSDLSLKVTDGKTLVSQNRFRGIGLSDEKTLR